jgi:hypothetical protein
MTIMRRFFAAAVATATAVLLAGNVNAQDIDTVPPPPPPPATMKMRAQARSADHFMLQLGYTTWVNKPDSIHTKGFPRTVNVYLMLDFPFKTNPKWSVAIGPGIATDNIYFDKMYVGIKDAGDNLRFQDLSDTNHFKKYKLATAYLEAPVELRYRFNPNDDRRSVKIAVGAKIGTLVNAHVKGKDFQDKNENTLLGYTQKENSKRFFNRNRLSVTARAGYGHFTLFASYAITPIFKEGFGPQVRPLTLGLTLSGL